MSRPGALICLAALAICVVVVLRGPGSAASFGTPSPFARDLVLTVPPDDERPSLTDVDAQVRMLVRRANATWAAAFARTGLPYTEAGLRIGPTTRSSGCSLPPQAAYCAATREVVVNPDFLLRTRALDPYLAFDGLAFVVGHELGHHVDGLVGGQIAGRSGEMHASCLAGAFLRAYYRLDPAARAFVSDHEHGPGAEQSRWYDAGRAAARPADCDRLDLQELQLVDGESGRVISVGEN